MITLLSSMSNIIYASPVDSSVNLAIKEDCQMHVQYYKESQGIWSYILCSYVGYEENGKTYPAYCLNPGIPRS